MTVSLTATPTTAQDRDTRAADVGTWLFLASLVMFYGALFSGYVLLRAGSDTWDTPWKAGALAQWPMTVDHWFRTMWLGFAVMQSRRITGLGAVAPGLPRFAWLAVPAGAMFVWRSWVVADILLRAGATPASSVPMACWFVLTGTVACLVAGGAMASAWIAIERVPPVQRARRGAMLARYWLVVLGIWLVTVTGLYLG
jgi:heme/copper-type cytochrome/quinol oxidase subunit 3